MSESTEQELRELAQPWIKRARELFEASAEIGRLSQMYVPYTAFRIEGARYALKDAADDLVERVGKGWLYQKVIEDGIEAVRSAIRDMSQTLGADIVHAEEALQKAKALKGLVDGTGQDGE